MSTRRAQGKITARRKAKTPAVEHPGVLAAHDGPLGEAECDHPASRRDLKNPGRCCACSAVGLDPPPVKRRR